MELNKTVFPSEIVSLRSKQNLEHLCKKIQVLRAELKDEIESCGMVGKAVDKFLAGEKVIVCTDCKTPNMYREFSHPAELYRCSNCDTTYAP